MKPWLNKRQCRESKTPIRLQHPHTHTPHTSQRAPAAALEAHFAVVIVAAVVVIVAAVVVIVAAVVVIVAVVVVIVAAVVVSKEQEMDEVHPHGGNFEEDSSGLVSV